MFIHVLKISVNQSSGQEYVKEYDEALFAKKTPVFKKERHLLVSIKINIYYCIFIRPSIFYLIQFSMLTP